MLFISVSIGVLSAVVPTQMLEVLKFIKEKTISQKYYIGARDRVMQERLKEKLALLFIVLCGKVLNVTQKMHQFWRDE